LILASSHQNDIEISVLNLVSSRYHQTLLLL